MSSRGKAALVAIALIIKAGIAMAEGDKLKGDDNRGNTGIITYQQNGDNYIVQSKPPTASFVGEPVVHKRDDGTVSLRMMLRLSTQHPPNAMVVAVRKEDVVIFGDMRKLGIEVTCIGRTELQTGENDQFYIARVIAPTAGDYVVAVEAKSAEVKPRFVIEFQ
jgi:hypothetical protein